MKKVVIVAGIGEEVTGRAIRATVLAINFVVLFPSISKVVIKQIYPALCWSVRTSTQMNASALTARAWTSAHSALNLTFAVRLIHAVLALRLNRTCEF